MSLSLFSVLVMFSFLAHQVYNIQWPLSKEEFNPDLTYTCGCYGLICTADVRVTFGIRWGIGWFGFLTSLELGFLTKDLYSWGFLRSCLVRGDELADLRILQPPWFWCAGWGGNQTFENPQKRVSQMAQIWFTISKCGVSMNLSKSEIFSLGIWITNVTCIYGMMLWRWWRWWYVDD